MLSMVNLIKYYHLCTKLLVPSIGSIIQVGLSVSTFFLPAAVFSSPIKLKKIWAGFCKFSFA